MSKKKTTTAVAKKEETGVREYDPSIMDEMEVDATDIILPRVLCLQSTSEMVSDGKGSPGELRDSLSGNLLGKKGEELEIIFYNPFKTWVIFKNNTFTQIVDYNKDNANWEWEEQVGPDTITRKKVLNYYVALPKDIESGEYIPKVIGFQSTAYKTGRKIESKRTFLSKFKKPLCTHVFKISTLQKENEKGRWFIPDVVEHRDSTVEEINAITEWAQIMKRSNVTVDDSEFKQEGPAEDYDGRDF